MLAYGTISRATQITELQVISMCVYLHSTETSSMSDGHQLMKREGM